MTDTWPRPARVLHYYERYKLSYLAYIRKTQGKPSPNKGGDPEVFSLNQLPKTDSLIDRPVLLTKELQFWWLDLLNEATRHTLSTAQLKQAWRNLTMDGKAYNNKKGREHGYCDFVLKENMGKEPMSLLLTIAGGATVLVTGDKFKRGRDVVYPIKVLDAFDPTTLNVTYETGYNTIFCATNSTVLPKPFGTVTNFPYTGIYPTPVPLLNNYTTTSYIEAGWIKFIPETERVNPYYKFNGVY